MVENCLRVHIEVDSGEYGVGPSLWTKLSTWASCLLNNFLKFQVQTPSFVFVEIGINSRVLTIPYMVQLVIKPISPLRGEIIPLLVQTFIIPIPKTTIVSQPMESSERSNKE
jgi:hypothetical protein